LSNESEVGRPNGLAKISWSVLKEEKIVKRSGKNDMRE
jgi:hypothetical protein